MWLLHPYEESVNMSPLRVRYRPLSGDKRDADLHHPDEVPKLLLVPSRPAGAELEAELCGQRDVSTTGYQLLLVLRWVCW